MTALWVSGVVATLISLALDLVPGLSEKWAGFSDETKRWGWLVGCLVVPLAVVGLCCLGPCYLGVACTADGVASALAIGAAAYIPSQGSHAAVKSVASRVAL